MTMMTMTMAIFYSTIDMQIEICSINFNIVLFMNTPCRVRAQTDLSMYNVGNILNTFPDMILQ